MSPGHEGFSEALISLSGSFGLPVWREPGQLAMERVPVWSGSGSLGCQWCWEKPMGCLVACLWRFGGIDLQEAWEMAQVGAYRDLKAYV